MVVPEVEAASRLKTSRPVGSKVRLSDGGRPPVSPVRRPAKSSFEERDVRGHRLREISLTPRVLDRLPHSSLPCLWTKQRILHRVSILCRAGPGKWVSTRSS